MTQPSVVCLTDVRSTSIGIASVRSTGIRAEKSACGCFFLCYRIYVAKAISCKTRKYRV